MLKQVDGKKSRNIREIMQAAGLRPTRQRMDLGELLFGGSDRHVTAELLHEEALGKRIPVSLATVYNTLHQFTRAGLLREVAVCGSKTYFDTNIGNHHHYYIEKDGRVLDISGPDLRVDGIAEPPEGLEVSRIDVVVHLREKTR